MSLESNDGERDVLIEFLEARVAEWEKSEVRKWMMTGKSYHDGDNDIKKRKRFLIGRNGEEVTPKYLSQAKIPHNFLRKLVRQKVSYLLSTPFKSSSENKTLQELFDVQFRDDFYRLLKNIGQDAVVEGVGWSQVYYDQEGRLSQKRIPAPEVIPFWDDIDHTTLTSAIRRYDTIEYDGADKITVKRVQYLDHEGIWNFVYSDHGLEVDPETPWEPHFYVSGADAEESQVGVLWSRIPLIPFKYNSEEIPLIYFIKDIVDDYDLNTSDLSNELQDEPNSPKVVRNYDGTDKGEFVHNLATMNTLFVRDDGEVTSLSTKIDHSARDSHLNRLRKDLYELGGGVDTQIEHLGNASGVALKFIYSDLDLDCEEFANELRWSLRMLIWFLIEDINLRTGENLHNEAISIEFMTNTAINESERITDLKESVGMISRETIIEQHPMVVNSEIEQKRIESETQKTLSQLMEGKDSE
jgi:SPP1 family phage portal protein